MWGRGIEGVSILRSRPDGDGDEAGGVMRLR